MRGETHAVPVGEDQVPIGNQPLPQGKLHRT
jgi:hypothetical protein